jgi:xanthine dehydrogenase accessory factor
MDADGRMSDWLDTLEALRARRAPCVLVTVVEALGSTPRDAGTKMVVTADALHGTIGGGNLEHKAIGEARRLLVRGETRPRMREFPLGPLLGQCCGGSTSILFEPMVPVARRLWLFGAGQKIHHQTQPCRGAMRQVLEHAQPPNLKHPAQRGGRGGKETL